MRPIEMAWVLIMGTLFGVLIGAALNEEARTWAIRALATFLAVALVAFLTTPKRRE